MKRPPTVAKLALVAEARQSRCKGKVIFLSFTLAQRACGRARWNGARDNRAPYRCRECSGFHVGGSEVNSNHGLRSDYKRRLREAREAA